MRFLICAAAVGMGLLFTAKQAIAQYPSFSSNGHGHQSHYSHHDHHYVQPARPYVQRYGEQPSYGLSGSLPPVYGRGIAYPQYTTPPVTSYQSNNYYIRPNHSHHNWHLGHYLLGHH